MDGNADSSPGDGSGVGDEIEDGGVEGAETETDHEGSGDGDRRAESSAAFDEGAETKRDEKKLQAAIRGDTGDGLLHDLELPGFDRDVVEKDRGDDNPDNFEKAKGTAIEEAGKGEAYRHAKDSDGDDNGRGSTGDGAPMRANFQAGKQAKEHDDGERGNKGGEPPVAERVIDLGPSHPRSSAQGEFEKESDPMRPLGRNAEANDRDVLPANGFCRA